MNENECEIKNIKPKNKLNEDKLIKNKRNENDLMRTIIEEPTKRRNRQNEGTSYAISNGYITLESSDERTSDVNRRENKTTRMSMMRIIGNERTQKGNGIYTTGQIGKGESRSAPERGRFIFRSYGCRDEELEKNKNDSDNSKSSNDRRKISEKTEKQKRKSTKK